jgi:hypothetical protein
MQHEEINSIELSKTVAAATAFLLDFDGPSTSHVGGVKYTTLCSGGAKHEGEDTPLFFGWDDAVKAYEEQLREFVKGGQKQELQLAWRARPKLMKRGGGFYVYSRLAVLTRAA